MQYYYLLARLLLLAFPAAATVLVSYNAAKGDNTDVLGQLNLEGWNDANWPSDPPVQNSSLYFKTSVDPSNKPAAHVHKAAHFSRAEYHSLYKKTAADTTYYIGYHVMWQNVDYQTIVWQWKNYDADTVHSDDICAGLVFRKDPNDSANHTM